MRKSVFGSVKLGCTQLEDRVVPAVFVVDTLMDEDNGSIAAGNFSLREAINKANTDTAVDTIQFSPTILQSGAQINLTLGLLSITKPVQILGPGANQLGISGVNTSGIFYIDFTTARIEGLTMSNAKLTATYGGAVYADFSNVTIYNCSFESCQAKFGGAGYFSFSTVNIWGSTFISNRAADLGGALRFFECDFVVSNSTIVDGAVKLNGGGIAVHSSSTFHTQRIINCTIANNQADSDANGSGLGGNIYYDTSSTGPKLELYNSIVVDGRVAGADNDLAVSNVNSKYTAKYNIIGSPASGLGIIDGVDGNKLGIKPLVGTRQNNGGTTATYLPQQNSPTLGAGSTTVPDYIPIDQRGAARDATSPDIGATEAQHPLAPVGVPISLDRLYQPKPSVSTNQAFVKGLYQATLLRAPDAAGLSGWMDQLAAGTTRDVVANGFVNSLENRRNQVTFFYRYFLKREPDTAGLNYWTDSLRGGADEGQVMVNFVLSPEFSGSNDNAAFVNLMYYAILGRKAETAGFNGWMSSLAGGMSRATVVNSFLRSTESIQRVVSADYQSYFKRAATSSDLNTQQTYLNSNTFGKLAITLLASTEFYNNAAANLT